MTSSLALLGGTPIIQAPFTPYNSMGQEEADAAKAVVETGVLSKYLGTWSPDFYGGPQVKAFEKSWAEYFGTRHAISVNSWTSGLIAAVGALDIEPGDEIIVSPWTMCASATAILHWNAIPVFADIEATTFCIDPQSVLKNITSKTKAILAVDIAGQSADMQSLMQIAKEHNLKVISDTAQAPGAKYHGNYAGTLADIGGFSLNYHKHIHTGEGGMIVTNDDALAERMYLIRNHAEAVVEKKQVTQINNMIGYNFRMGEIEAAIGIEQLKKLKVLIETRQYAAQRLSEGLSRLEGLHLPAPRDHSTHVYYLYQMILDVDLLGISRDVIFEALKAEGVTGLANKYVNVHLLPMYQQKIAYGKSGFPWTHPEARENIRYDKGICPVAESLNDKSYLGYEMCLHQLNDSEIELIIAAFQKVWKYRNELKNYVRR